MPRQCFQPHSRHRSRLQAQPECHLRSLQFSQLVIRLLSHHLNPRPFRHVSQLLHQQRNHRLFQQLCLLTIHQDSRRVVRHPSLPATLQLNQVRSPLASLLLSHLRSRVANRVVSHRWHRRRNQLRSPAPNHQLNLLDFQQCRHRVSRRHFLPSNQPDPLRVSRLLHHLCSQQAILPRNHLDHRQHCPQRSLHLGRQRSHL